jgi:hypothetical protein
MAIVKLDTTAVTVALPRMGRELPSLPAKEEVPATDLAGA